MELSFSVFAVTILLVWLILRWRKAAKKWAIYAKIPGPSQLAYPLIGHARLLNSCPDNTYASLLKITEGNIECQTSNIVCIWWGPMPVVLIKGPKAAEEILRSSEHLDKTYFYQFFHNWLGTGLLTSTGSKWRSRRKLLTPTFHFSILKDFLPIMNDKAEIFTERIGKFAGTNNHFELFKPVGLCALDIICETAMGENVNAQVDEESEYVTSISRVSHLFFDRIKRPWMWPDASYNLTEDGRECSERLDRLHKFTESVIRDRMKHKENVTQKNRRQAFLDLLINVSDGGKQLSINDIREEVDTFMFEGHDTSSAGMTWTLYLVGLHPDVQRRIQEELDEVFNDDENRNITFEDLRKLQYLEMVIKESHRLLPPVPLVGRNTAHDCKLDGYEIPKETTCILFIQKINNNPEYWTDPERFDPERFSTDNCEGRHPYSYVPFSAGPRNCIGQKFALMEEKVVLAHTLRKFEVESRDKFEDVEMLGDLIMRPMDGVYVKLKKRKNAT